MEFFSRVNRVTADRYLVGSRAEVFRGNIEGGVKGAIGIGELAYPAADCERHEDLFGSAFQDVEHGLIGEGKISESGDIQKSDFIRAFGKIPVGQFNRFAEVAHLALLSYIVLVALGDHQIAVVVASHIEAGNDPFGQLGFFM